MSVFNEKGETFELFSLWSAQRSVVAFTRHLGCPFCKEQVALLEQLSKHYKDETGSEIGTIVVAIGKYEDIPRFKAEVAYTGDMYVDTDLERPHCFEILNLARGADLVFEKGTDPKDFIIRKDILEMGKRLTNSIGGYGNQDTGAAFTGDLLQVGGVFVLGPGNACDFAYRSEFMGDAPDMADVYAAVAGRNSDTGKELIYPSTERWNDQLKVTTRMEHSLEEEEEEKQQQQTQLTEDTASDEADRAPLECPIRKLGSSSSPLQTSSSLPIDTNSSFVDRSKSKFVSSNNSASVKGGGSTQQTEEKEEEEEEAEERENGREKKEREGDGDDDDDDNDEWGVWVIGTVRLMMMPLFGAYSLGYIEQDLLIILALAIGTAAYICSKIIEERRHLRKKKNSTRTTTTSTTSIEKKKNNEHKQQQEQKGQGENEDAECDGEDLAAHCEGLQLVTMKDVDTMVLKSGLQSCECSFLKSINMTSIKSHDKMTRSTMEENEGGYKQTQSTISSKSSKGNENATDEGDGDSVIGTDEINKVQALEKIQCYVREFLAKPNPNLGRKGPTCPFVPTAIKFDVIYLCWVPHELSVSLTHIKAVVTSMLQRFKTLEPSSGPKQQYKTIIMVFPHVTVGDAPRLIDSLQKKMKPLFVEEGLMLGEFHKANNASGLHNEHFYPLRTPHPCLAIRTMVPSDIVFLNDKEVSLQGRRKMIQKFLDKFGDKASNDAQSKMAQELLEKLK